MILCSRISRFPQFLFTFFRGPRQMSTWTSFPDFTSFANFMSLLVAPRKNVKSGILLWLPPCMPSPRITRLLVRSSWYAVVVFRCTINVPCFFSLSIPRSLCGMLCYVAGTGTGPDGRNQRTVVAGGRAGSGERRLAMLSVGTLQLTTWLELTQISGLLVYDAVLISCDS